MKTLSDEDRDMPDEITVETLRAFAIHYLPDRWSLTVSFRAVGIAVDLAGPNGRPITWRSLWPEGNLAGRLIDAVNVARVHEGMRAVDLFGKTKPE